MPKKVTIAFILFLVVLALSPLVMQRNVIEKGIKETNSNLSSQSGDSGEKNIVDKENEKIEAIPPEKKINITGLEPNEKGKIMILMYHRIGDKESTWTRTRENFKKDLEVLYKKGYRLVSIKDYLNNSINTPLGTTPVVITFDDGSPGQFNFIEKNGELIIDPDCAVGIMKEFYERYPDFGLEATFFINSRPFHKKYWKEAMEKIIQLGMDLGNHTLTHVNLKTASADIYYKEIGGLVQHVQEVVPEYEVDVLALPFGGYPKYVEKAISGDYKGITYKNKGILLVGARPAPSPADEQFNYLAIPRIRADEENLYRWIQYFDKNPEQRYVSDGIAK